MDPKIVDFSSLGGGARALRELVEAHPCPGHVGVARGHQGRREIFDETVC